MRFIDSNVFLRYLTQDDPRQQQLAAAIVASIARGDEECCTTDVHIHETVYILASPAGYKMAHQDISNIVRPLVAMPGLKIRNKRRCLDALDIFAQHEFLDFADALAIAYMRQHGVTDVYSFDRDFNRINDVTRLEAVPVVDS